MKKNIKNEYIKLIDDPKIRFSIFKESNNVSNELALDLIDFLIEKKELDLITKVFELKKTLYNHETNHICLLKIHNFYLKERKKSKNKYDDFYFDILYSIMRSLKNISNKEILNNTKLLFEASNNLIILPIKFYPSILGLYSNNPLLYKHYKKQILLMMNKILDSKDNKVIDKSLYSISNYKFLTYIELRKLILFINFLVANTKNEEKTHCLLIEAVISNKLLKAEDIMFLVSCFKNEINKKEKNLSNQIKYISFEKYINVLLAHKNHSVAQGILNKIKNV